MRHDFGGIVGTRYGGQAHGLLQTSLCLKRDVITDIYAMARLQDVVSAVLQEGQTIPLRDFGTSGGPTIGRMQVGATTIADVDTGQVSGVMVRALSTELTSSTAWTLV
jgi:hypothetical protein